MNAPSVRPYRVIHVGSDPTPKATRVHHVEPVREAPHLVESPDRPASPEVLALRLEALVRAVWENPTALLALAGTLDSLRRSVGEHQGRAITAAAAAVRRRIQEFEEDDR